MAKKNKVEENPENVLDLDQEEKNEKKDKKEKRQKKKGFPFVPVIVLVIIVGAIVAVLFFNILDVRERWIMPYLRNAPLVGSWFPPQEEPEEPDPGRFGSYSEEELLGAITAMEIQISRLENDLKEAESGRLRDANTITILREYEKQQVEYRRIKELFDEMVARGDPSGYKEFFEFISPENAERLYQESAEEVQYNAEMRRLANSYSAMSPKAAAEGFDLLLVTDPDVVLGICAQLSSRVLAPIMEAMLVENMVRLTRLLYPDEPAHFAASAAPPLPEPGS